MSPGRITSLAANIQDDVTILETYLQSADLPSPSFDQDFPAKISLPGPIVKSLQNALAATDELHLLLLGPIGFILNQLDATHNMISLHAINRFKIAKHVPLGQQISFSEVAVKCAVDENSMSRLLRHAITNHIFTEPQPEFIAHTSISRALAEIPSLHEFVTVSCEEMWAPTTKVVDAMVKWPASEEPNQTAFNLASGTQRPFFQELGSSPERIENFSKAMDMFKMMPGFEPSLIIDAQLWNTVTGTVVDVGGADGAVAFELVKKFPSLKIIVQDLPNVIDNAQDSRTTTDFPSQVTFQHHDFFSEQRIHGADVYLFRMIFHDWSDKFCNLILQNLIPALKNGARILINDFCIPETGTTSMYHERLARCHDLSMKAMFNGKERNRKEWETLLSKDDPRFKIVSVEESPSSQLTLFEVVWTT